MIRVFIILLILITPVAVYSQDITLKLLEDVLEAEIKGDIFGKDKILTSNGFSKAGDIYRYDYGMVSVLTSTKEITEEHTTEYRVKIGFFDGESNLFHGVRDEIAKIKEVDSVEEQGNGVCEVRIVDERDKDEPWLLLRSKTYAACMYDDDEYVIEIIHQVIDEEGLEIIRKIKEIMSDSLLMQQLIDSLENK